MDENSEKKPLNRCIFFLPLAGGALAVKVGGVFFSGCKQILKDLVWRSQMPAFHTSNVLEQKCMFDDFSHIRRLTVPLYIRELCFKLMNFCFVSKSASVGHS